MAWDGKRDLALLRVVAAQSGVVPSPSAVDRESMSADLVTLPIAASMPMKTSPTICIGHPGSEDLEADEEGVKTYYPVLAVSEGQYLGYAKGQDVQDNSDIGALMHNA